MTSKERFLDICKREIKRDGIDKLIEFICSPQSDFFTAPASTRFHSCHEGGLVEHSLNVYDSLCAYLESERAKTLGLEYSRETIALCALFHDLCKINTYKVSMRNTKDETGQWIKVPYYEFDDKLPYGHGEKSVYMLSGFIRLSRDEAFAIRYHAGFAASEDSRNISKVYTMNPLALALYMADLEATYIVEEEC